jgi:hypothetical protein
MDSHQRRVIAREMRRLGLGTEPPNQSQHPAKATEVRFIETPKFAIALAFFSLAASIVLTVLGVRMKQLSWLFIVAWIFAIPAVWISSVRLKSRSLRLAVNILVLAAVAVGLYSIDFHTRLPKEIIVSPVTLVWGTPNAVMVGSHLTAEQLNAKALSNGREVSGTFVYNPTFGSTPEAGTDTLSVSFTANDPTHFSPTTSAATVALVVIDPHGASQSAAAPIEIFPHEVVFRQFAIKGGPGTIPSQFSQQYSFRITNTTNRDVYSIGAELKIKSDSLSVDDFNLDVPKSSWKPLNNTGISGLQMGDMMALGIRSKQTNKTFFVVELAHLEPHESREITIWESDAKDGSKDKATVTATIYHSKFEPLPMLRSSKGFMSMPNVPLPESGTLEKMMILKVAP